MSDITINKAKLIKLVLFDVDGVLTNGHIFFCDAGHKYKGFHAQDGLGIKLLLASGIQVGIISSDKSDAVEQRMKKLGITLVYQGHTEKTPIYESLCQKLNLTDENVAYVGDDLPDIPLIQRAGLGIAVANATTPLHQVADWVTQKPGGQGAAREVCELILQAKGLLGSVYTPYLNQTRTPTVETV